MNWGPGRYLTLGCCSAAAILLLGVSQAAASTSTTSTTVPQSSSGDSNDPGVQLLGNTGGALCPISGITSTSTASAFLLVGGEHTSQVTEEATTAADNPFQVTVEQGTDVGIKLVSGLKEPPILASAMVTAEAGYSSKTIYAVPTASDAAEIVAFAENPTVEISTQTAKLLMGSVQQTYSAGDASIGGSLSAFSFLGGSAGLGGSVGVAHDNQSDYTEYLTTPSTNAEVNAQLGVAKLNLSVQAGATQDVVFGKDNSLTGVIDTFDLDGGVSAGLAKSLATAGATGTTDGAKESGGAVEDGTVDFGLRPGLPGTGDAIELVGALSLAGAGATYAPEVTSDLADEAGAAATGNFAGAGLAAFDILSLIGNHGFVIDRQDHIDSISSGIDVSAGLYGLGFSLDFGGTDESTTLVHAYHIDAQGRITPYRECSPVIHLPVVAGQFPGIGATMGGWITAHPADPAHSNSPSNPPCPASAPPTCTGGFSLAYGPGNVYGDTFQWVEPSQGGDCPIPFVASALDAELASCRVAEMLVVLPHPVGESEARSLAATQMPKDATVTTPAPPIADLVNDIRCETWTSPSLGGLPTLGDEGGTVTVSYVSGLSGTASIGNALEGLLGLLPSGGSYNPQEIYAIGLTTGNGDLHLC